MELPIGYERYRGFKNFSKEATVWHLLSLGNLAEIQSCREDQSCFATSVDLKIEQDNDDDDVGHSNHVLRGKTSDKKVLRKHQG